ncbi:hypothetical protein [Streptomyces sp. NPDC059460]
MAGAAVREVTVSRTAVTRTSCMVLTWSVTMIDVPRTTAGAGGSGTAS